jgi:hypothetical protein
VHEQNGRPATVTTLFTQENSFVVTSGFCFNLTTMSRAEQPTEGVIIRFADPENQSDV